MGEAADDELVVGVVDHEELLMATGPASSGRAAVARIDPAIGRFPFCLVWSPIPILTWVLPFIGHLGIADSKGYG